MEYDDPYQRLCILGHHGAIEIGFIIIIIIIITDMRGDLKNQMSSLKRHVVILTHVYPHNSTMKSRRSTKILAGRLFVPCVTLHTSSNFKGSKVKVTRRINAVTENQPYLRNGKANNHHHIYFTVNHKGTNSLNWLRQQNSRKKSVKPKIQKEEKKKNTKNIQLRLNQTITST